MDHLLTGTPGTQSCPGDVASAQKALPLRRSAQPPHRLPPCPRWIPGFSTHIAQALTDRRHASSYQQELAVGLSEELAVGGTGRRDSWSLAD